jgi:beta-glucosidase
LAFDVRAAALVAELTVSEKSLLLQTKLSTPHPPGIDRLKIPGYEWWHEALHGLALLGDIGVATSWPEVGSTMLEPETDSELL